MAACAVVMGAGAGRVSGRGAGGTTGAETGSGYQYNSGYYRPVTNVILWAEYRFAGANDWQYNLDGVLLHWLNCVLLAWIVWTLCDNLAAALLAGLLFGVHPINAFAATQCWAKKHRKC